MFAMNSEEILEDLSEENPEAMLADGLEGALVGVARRCGQPTLAVYSVQKAISVLIERDGMSEQDAMEFLEFNSVSAWVGPHTPIWLYD